MSDDHKHDWRVDPHQVLATHPPQQRLVCADCGDVKGGRALRVITLPTSNDPKEWPRA